MSSQGHLHSSWAVVATVATAGSSKGTHATVARLKQGQSKCALFRLDAEQGVARLKQGQSKCALFRLDVEQGGAAAAGRRAAVVAQWPTAVMGRLGGDGAPGEEECWRRRDWWRRGWKQGQQQ